MAGTFVPPWRLVEAARATAQKVREERPSDHDPTVARGWDIFADKIERDAKRGGYWE